MMPAKLTTPVFHKLKEFWNKCYDLIYFVYDVNKKILSGNSNHIVDGINFRIQSEYGKIRTRGNPYLDTFHIMIYFQKLGKNLEKEKLIS